MPRAFPVPLYTIAAAQGAPYSATQRALSTTSPGATDSTATVMTGGITNDGGYLTPEGSATKGTATVGAVGAVPVTAGWAVAINTTFAPTGDSVVLQSGTYTLPIRYSRPGGFLTGDMTGTITAVLMRVNSTLNTRLAEIGRGATTVTFTTTATNGSISITTAADTVLLAGEYLMLVLHLGYTGALTGDTMRLHTNSTAGVRISAGPTYTTQFARSVSDSAPSTDAITRAYTGNRALSDATPVTDALTRTATFPRTLADSTPIADAVTRLFTANRSLSDSATVADSLARRYTGFRALADAPVVTDLLTRRVIYARRIDDALSAGGGTTIIAPVFGLFE